MKSLYNQLDALQYNNEFIGYYLSNPYNNEWMPDTIINGIQKFPAGHFAILNDGKLEIKRYYDPSTLNEQSSKYSHIQDAVDEFKSLFASSCSLRMRSDVSVGSSLSGGIDSGLLVSTLAKHTPIKQQDYHAVISCFPGSVLDETENAVKVAQNAGVLYKQVNVNPNISPDRILKAVYDFEDIAGTSPLPFYQTYQAFRDNNILVTLDGHGGDELFGGYAFDLPEKLIDDFPNVFKMRQTLQTMNDMGDFRQRISIGLSFLYAKQEYQRRKINKVPIIGKIDAYQKKLHHSTFSGILPTLLRNYDKYSMRAGVEIRMPYLDYRIVEFAFRLPTHFKVNNGFSKYLLRQAGKSLMPDEIVFNKIKSGWNSPMGEWFNGVWKEWLLDEISSVEFNQCELVPTIQIRKTVEAFFENKDADQNLGQLIWLNLQPYLIEKANKLFHKSY
jgi:asparagine synthase (glutamine-hydrolysing)